jgi:plasmid stabilization system protein ParE
MAGKWPVTFSASAVADLDDIIRYYAGEHSPETGTRLAADIIAQAERLANFPESGRIVPEFAMEYLREIIYPPFRIVYRFDRKRLGVIRIWRSERMMKLP